MSDELKLRKDADRGAQAQALISNPLLVDAFKALENELMAIWWETRPEQAAERERIWVTVATSRKALRALQTVISDGKLAQHELNILLARGKRAA